MSKSQASPKELRWYDVIVSIDVELIHKPRRDNLVPDVLSRRKEFLEAKLHITMILSTIVYCDNSPLFKGMKEAYKIDENALEIKKAFPIPELPRSKEGLWESLQSKMV